MLGEMSGGVVEVAICSAHKSVDSNNQSPANSGGGLQPANQPLPSPVPAWDTKWIVNPKVCVSQGIGLSQNLFSSIQSCPLFNL